MGDSPQIVVMAGPNGAGKLTFASRYLPEGMVYVNADEVPKGLPDYPSTAADIQAGRMVLETMDEFEAIGATFAVETTLATRSLAARIGSLRESAYRFRLVFLRSPNPEFSIQRVASRVRSGGHHIPEETIRSRYRAGIRNFFDLYQPIADIWELLGNFDLEGPLRVASGRAGADPEIHDQDLWTMIRQGVRHETG